jgi:hypothetical protein
MGGNQIIVTPHACQRWNERVHPCSQSEAKAEIMAHSKAIRAAADFGCEAIKLPSRHRLVLDGTVVVTVLPQGRFV